MEPAAGVKRVEYDVEWVWVPATPTLRGRWQARAANGNIIQVVPARDASGRVLYWLVIGVQGFEKSFALENAEDRAFATAAALVNP